MVFDATDLSARLDVSRETMDRLHIYSDELVRWQKAKNLVAGATLGDSWQRHFLDSAQMEPLLRAHCAISQPRIVDIGAGAGFPGLVLAAMDFGRVRLVEANGRKCSFMRQTALKMGVSVDVDNRRIEDINDVEADIIISRACASIDQLLTWGAPLLAPGGEFWLLKGEKADDELTRATASWNMSTETFGSISDPGGIILRLTDVHKKD